MDIVWNPPPFFGQLHDLYPMTGLYTWCLMHGARYSPNLGPRLTSRVLILLPSLKFHLLQKLGVGWLSINTLCMYQGALLIRQSYMGCKHRQVEILKLWKVEAGVPASDWGWISNIWESAKIWLWWEPQYAKRGEIAPQILHPLLLFLASLPLVTLSCSAPRMLETTMEGTCFSKLPCEGKFTSGNCLSSGDLPWAKK